MNIPNEPKARKLESLTYSILARWIGHDKDNLQVQHLQVLLAKADGNVELREGDLLEGDRHSFDSRPRHPDESAT